MKKIIFIIIAIVGFTIPSYSQYASDLYKNVRESDGWLQKGYRGFVETGGGADVNYRLGSFFINTTHGYQFSEWFFAGAGLGYLSTRSEHYSYYIGYYNESENSFEYYADFRLTIPTPSRFYPFADFKIGGAAYPDFHAVYINGELGTRFALNENLGLSLGIYINYVDCDVAEGPIIGAALGFDF